MRYRIQTDGEKFRVQKKVMFWWVRGSVDRYGSPMRHVHCVYRPYDTRAEAQEWIDEVLNQPPKPEWTTV